MHHALGGEHALAKQQAVSRTREEHVRITIPDKVCHKANYVAYEVQFNKSACQDYITDGSKTLKLASACAEITYRQLLEVTLLCQSASEHAPHNDCCIQ